MSTPIEGITLLSTDCSDFSIWEWESAPGVWHCYSPAIMVELETLRASLNGTQKPKSDATKCPTYAFISIGEVQYLIDVKTFVQTRLDTSTRRNIRRTRIVGSWELKGEVSMELDQTGAATVEYHRREHASSKVFDIKVRNKQLRSFRLRIDLNIMTWTIVPPRTATDTTPIIEMSGSLVRVLPPPPALPHRKSRGRLWVPKTYMGRSSATSPVLPPFPSSTSDIDWKSPPSTLRWVREAPFPSLGVKWNVPPASEWTSLYCLGYGKVTYQALLETDNRSRLLDDAVVIRRKDAKAPTQPRQHDANNLVSTVSHSHDEECRICSENTSTQTTIECARCNFRYCEDCFDVWLRPSGGRPGVQCPQCKMPIADTRGTQPSGWLEWWILPPGLLPVPGHEDQATLLLNYDFPDGEQISGHLNPGAPFRGDQRVGFFPYCPETAGLLPLFLRCFNTGRTFTVGESLTTGEQNTLIWGGVHHKTSLDQNAAHGYPDNSYFKRVEEELRAQHVNPETDDARVLLSGDPSPLGVCDYAVGVTNTPVATATELKNSDTDSRPRTAMGGRTTGSGRSTPSDDENDSISDGETSPQFFSPTFETSVSGTLADSHSSRRGMGLLRRTDATSWDEGK